VFSLNKEISMFRSKSATTPAMSAAVADAGKIRLGGGYRLPASTADVGKIRLGGGYRLPAKGV
jgi:hypothetical protein